MMAGRTYPQFPAGIETRLAAVKMAAGKGADARAWIDDPACPYSGILKEALAAFVLGAEGLLLPGAGGTNLEVPPLFQADVSDEDAADGVLTEIERTIDALRNVERSLQVDDVEGKVSIIKTKTALLQKWSELKDKVLNMKNVAEFQRIVIETVDGHLDKDQIQEFKSRIRELAK